MFAGYGLLRQADLLLASQERDGAHLRQVHSDRIIDPLGALFGDGLFHRSLSLRIVQNLRLALSGGLGRRSGRFAEFFAVVDMDRIGRDVSVFVHHLDLRRSGRLPSVVTLELQIRLQRSIDLFQATTTSFDLVDQFDPFKSRQSGEGIDRVGIDVTVGEARIDLLVADPTAFAAGFDEFGESGVWTK